MVFTVCCEVQAELYQQLRYEKQELKKGFFAEGVASGDFNRDGHPDVTAGPFWFEGPDFTVSHEIYTPEQSDPLKYSDHFFSFAHDLNRDGWVDVMVYGFPGKEARWYENPGASAGMHWECHPVHNGVGNESPTFADINQDGRPDIVCITEGQYVWVEADWDRPGDAWTKRPISEPLELKKFTHGLGLADINDDGRMDLLHRSGWFEQPADLSEAVAWKSHSFPFSLGRGGCQMYAVDFTGDGLKDVVTSKNAHGYGLSWFEQARSPAGQIEWKEHVLLSDDFRRAPTETLFSQLHAMDVADMDGDGLIDLVVGKRWWAHGPKKDPEPNSPAVVYIFRQVREKGATRFEPYLVDDDSGAGVQLALADLNHDGRLDILSANKKGIFVFRSRR